MPAPRNFLLLLLLQVVTSKSAKDSASPVYEVINEQARMDDKRIQTSPGLLPYGNPLAGNSLQNAKLHAQNQQAMFQAERVRQHRAQLQRWTQAPIKMDSYMKAYHESQENHQLAIEQQQAVDRKPSTRTQQPSNIDKKPTTRSPTRQRQRRPDLRRTKGPDPLKITLEDAVPDKSRNHRSYGSLDFRQQPKSFKTVLITPGPTYDQGVTIKPNGNVGIATLQQEEESKLLTEAVASNEQIVYPKQFHQMQHYESAHDIAALNELLKKQPHDQVHELNALLHTEQHNKELETPIDLYFYLKDPKFAPYYSKSLYAKPQNYASAYMPEIKDHTPISEEIDDIEDPNKILKKPYTEPIHTEDITTNAINFYKVDPTVVTKTEFQRPIAQELHYKKPLAYAHSGDTSERYLHHNIHFSGVQHLTEDGSGVSAYGDDLHYAANYEFGYHVRDHHSGNDFGHQEAKKGEETKGNYHVLLPDGRMQRVKYFAGPEGFHADVSYDVHK